MRLIWTIDNERDLLTFYYFLLTKGIESHIEISPKGNEGKEVSGTLWIIDEDDLNTASKWLEEFKKDPQHPQFQGARFEGQAIESAQADQAKQAQEAVVQMAARPPRRQEQTATGSLTFVTAVACIALFTMFLLESLGTTGTPVGSIYQPYWFDYTARQELRDQRIAEFGDPTSSRPEDLPIGAQELFSKEVRTPAWQGFYTHVRNYLRNPDRGFHTGNEPLFERISEGQVWRLFTPCLLHGSILHIFFNMLWLFVLGAQLERRLGMLRYALFILITGVFSNTAQYLMSGWSFLGYSGVICAMLTFVWLRQKRSPWEGYQLQPGTVTFITIFVSAFALAQLASFIFEIYGNPAFVTGIANTAHIAGGISGLILAKIPLFRAQD